MKYELIRDSPNDFWISIHQRFLCAMNDLSQVSEL